MLLILLLAALLRFYNLSGQSLWADEGNSAALAQQDVTEIARRTAFDIHPPLYYWLLKGWTAVLAPARLACARCRRYWVLPWFTWSAGWGSGFLTGVLV